MILFARHFVDAIHVDRIERMRFRNRELTWAPVNLARAREHDFDFRITGAAGLEDGKLGLAIDLQVRHRIEHRIEVARLPGEVEEVIFSLHQVPQAMAVANIGDVDLDAVANVFDVIKIAAVIRDQTIDDRHLRAKLNETPREIRSDEAQAAGDEHARIGERVVHARLQLLHAVITASTSSSLMKGWTGRDTSSRANRRAFLNSADELSTAASLSALWSGTMNG